MPLVIAYIGGAIWCLFFCAGFTLLGIILNKPSLFLLSALFLATTIFLAGAAHEIIQEINREERSSN